MSFLFVCFQFSQQIHQEKVRNLFMCTFFPIILHPMNNPVVYKRASSLSYNYFLLCLIFVPGFGAGFGKADRWINSGLRFCQMEGMKGTWGQRVQDPDREWVKFWTGATYEIRGQLRE